MMHSNVVGYQCCRGPCCLHLQGQVLVLNVDISGVELFWFAARGVDDIHSGNEFGHDRYVIWNEM